MLSVQNIPEAFNLNSTVVARSVDLTAEFRFKNMCESG